MKNKRFKRLKKQIAIYLASSFNDPIYWIRHEESHNIYSTLNSGKTVKLYIPINSTPKNGIYADIHLTHFKNANLSIKIKIKSKTNSYEEFDEFITEMFVLNDHLSFIKRMTESFNLT